MNRLNLDLDTIRTFVVANDLGGYGQAAERLGRTPSAVSLQMKRLQHDVGAPLLRKDGRGLALTDVGAIALRYGRQMLALNDELLDTIRGAALAGSVRIGFSQDFAEDVVPAVLSRFAALYPMVTMEVRMDGNAALVNAVDKGQLDVALALGHEERAGAQTLGEAALVWIAARAFTLKAGEPVPLVLLGAQCTFRKEAIRKLDEASHPWRAAATSTSLNGVWAAVRGGLGVTVRSRLGLPDAFVHDPRLLGLPPLGKVAITLHRTGSDASAASERLCEIIREIVTSEIDDKRARAVTRKKERQRI